MLIYFKIKYILKKQDFILYYYYFPEVKIAADGWLMRFDVDLCNAHSFINERGRDL